LHAKRHLSGHFCEKQLQQQSQKEVPWVEKKHSKKKKTRKVWVVVGLAAGLLVKRMENSDEKLPAWNLNEWGGRWQVQRHQTNPNPGLKKKMGKPSGISRRLGSKL